VCRIDEVVKRVVPIELFDVNTKIKKVQ